MRTTTVLGLMAATVLTVAGCQPRPAAFSAQDEAAVRAGADSAVSYLRAGNLEAWTGLFSEDGVLQPPNAPAVKGRSALLAWVKGGPRVEDIAFTDVQVRGDRDLAYGTSGFRFAQKGLPPDTGKQLWVSRRAAKGKWEVVAVSFNSDLAPPGPQRRSMAGGQPPR